MYISFDCFDSILLAIHFMLDILPICLFKIVTFTRIVDENDACALCFATNGSKWLLVAVRQKQQHWMVFGDVASFPHFVRSGRRIFPKSVQWNEIPKSQLYNIYWFFRWNNNLSLSINWWWWSVSVCPLVGVVVFALWFVDLCFFSFLISFGYILIVRVHVWWMLIRFLDLIMVLHWN